MKFKNSSVLIFFFLQSCIRTRNLFHYNSKEGRLSFYTKSISFWMELSLRDLASSINQNWMQFHWGLQLLIFRYSNKVILQHYSEQKPPKCFVLFIKFLLSATSLQIFGCGRLMSKGVCIKCSDAIKSWRLNKNNRKKFFYSLNCDFQSLDNWY